MINLLKIEWLKIKSYKAFWIFTILYFFSILGINYTGYYINHITLESVPGSAMLLQTPYGFPKVWQTVGWMSSWLLYFPGILFIMLLTNEFNFKTHRQNVIDGWSRREFISVKFVFALLFAIVATLFNALVALLFGLLTSGSLYTFGGMEFIGYTFIQIFSYLTFAMFLAVLCRRSGIAIAIFFLYGLILKFLIALFVNNTLHLSPVGWFFPLTITDVILPIPFGNQVIYKDAPQVYVLLVASLVYLAGYYYFALRKFQTDDL